MMAARNIKTWICIACLASSLAAPTPDTQPQLYLDVIDMAAISRMSPQQLETLAEGLAAEEIMRTKRSSAQALTSAVVAKASSGLQSKLGLLGQASAFVASGSSKSGGDEHSGYSYEPHPQGDKYDYWGLKKSILYTLFQAVKAITGGVTILKGQLIKGGGALAATLGKVISVKGDAVSNIGKKIVNSAALSNKKPAATPVYGPPPPTHLEYGPPPSAYGAPTAPAHYSAPSLPTGYAGHKYPANLDGRGKLNGLHAGIVFLTPLGEPQETLQTAQTGHTPLEPPQSLLHTVYSAIKDVFTTAATHTADANPPPPPPQTAPAYPSGWGAINSYGEPAAPESYLDYDPRNVQPSYDYAAPKHFTLPKQKGLTPEKLQKINQNLSKLNVFINQRSSEIAPRSTNVDEYVDLFKKGQIPFLPTPVVSDNEIGVLPAELLPEDDIKTTTTTTEKPQTTTEDSEKKEVKYILRGNRIVQV
ncbi:hypothetical protein K1T71_005768 [Dendrolimus kikuchii]|uniref:Uncharacterized protein n=1 Tax=Dendrolimus kikuchii TaxID=765133 RepID=A0ACC1D5X6_9NEOP|nr:hypothetical protein K1T71_005768 [Dendrolimus kikuchii]